MHTRLATAVVALSMLVAASAFAGTDWQARAQASHPEDAAVLQGLSAEITLLKMALRTCDGHPCAQLHEESAALAESLDSLWRYVHAPDGKRPAIDDAWRTIEDQAMVVDDYLPQSGMDDIDAVMREWAGTRERMARFKRSMRIAAGDAPTASR